MGKSYMYEKWFFTDIRTCSLKQSFFFNCVMSGTWNAYWNLASKAVCVGRNYVAHVKELNNTIPSKPFFFLKPTSSFLPLKGNVEIPSYGDDLHHEVELCVIMGRNAKNVKKTNALDYVAGYAVGLDMTLRDVQNEKKKKGLPWTEAKAFDTSLALGAFIPKEDVKNPNDLHIWLSVDGKLRQSDSTKLMIYDVPTLIEAASSVMTLSAGDILCTGTPQGVSRVTPGQIMRAGIKGYEKSDIEFGVTKY
jgi:acylpyruvate hydrolase